MINKFTEVFSRDSEDHVESTFVHKIDLRTETPVKKTLSNTTNAEVDSEEKIRRILKIDVIQKSNNPYGAPIVQVKKRKTTRLDSASMSGHSTK